MSYHECRIKTKTEMTYDLVLISLILILLQKVSSTRKCDLIDIFFNLVGSHTDTVINDLDGLFFLVDPYFDLILITFGLVKLAYH